MDIAINQVIPDENRGKGWLMPSTFPHLKLELLKGTNYYYEKLMQAKDAQDKDIQACLEAVANGESSCELPSTGETVKIERHEWEVENSDMSEGTKHVLQAQISKLIKEAADQVTKSRGTIPSNIQEILDRLNKVDPPKFDWKGYIRRFVGCSTKVYVKKSRRKLNVRFTDNPGQRVKQHKHIMLGLDTSGSVSTAELKEFQNEMHHIQMNGTTITVVQFDSAISHIGPFNPRVPFEVKGREGTNFQQCIDHYNTNKRTFSCCIIMTDGEAPDPQNVQGNVLWVLSSKSGMTDHLTGKTIKLN